MQESICKPVTRLLVTSRDDSRLKIKKKDLKKGMLVRLDEKQWSSFVDTATPGMVMSWSGKQIEILFTNGIREQHWLWSLREIA
jgi:hypothetical protein